MSGCVKQYMCGLFYVLHPGSTRLHGDVYNIVQGIIYPDSHRNLRTKNACMRLKFSLARENLRHGTRDRE